MDIDGTLINKAGAISDIDQEALAAVRNAGIKVSLCTGRTTNACLDLLNTLSLDDYHIFFDGALVYNCQQNEEVYSQPISAELVNKICRVALLDGIPLDLFSSTQYFVIEESWRSNIRRDFFGIESTVADFKTLWQKEKIIKGGIVVSSPDEERRARAYITKFADFLSFSWTVTPAFPDYSFINIIDIGVSKGKALEALISHLGMRMPEVIAIGDGSNDISLLSAAGFSIAMQNAPPELKSVADYITADVEQSGVAQAIHKFIL